MKSISILSLALVSILAAVTTTSAAMREEFRGRWSRDCGHGRVCHVDVGDGKDARNVEIAFTVEGGDQPCRWSVNAVYDASFGGPVAMDPYANHGFYLAIMQDGRLYSSGTMPQVCMALPRDQYYVSNAAAVVDNRNYFVHNGSSMLVDPDAGVITYDSPKQSIAGSVQPGMLLFRAYAPWNPDDGNALVSGTAYVFKKGCAPAPYPVSGRHEGRDTLVLYGAAPVREKHGCRVVGYRMNGNSRLIFTVLGD
jgi:hypothetical protein